MTEGNTDAHKNKFKAKTLNRVVADFKRKSGIVLNDLHEALYSKPPPKDILQIPTPADTNQDAIKYLKEKGIDADIIADCIDKGLIYQSAAGDKMSEKIIFASRDEKGNIQRLSNDFLHREARHINPTAVDRTGSDLSYPFVLKGYEDATSIFVFNDPMEALSHATIHKINGFDPKSVHRVAIAHAGYVSEGAKVHGNIFKGCSFEGLQKFLRDFSSKTTKITVCMSHDHKSLAQADKLHTMQDWKATYPSLMQAQGILHALTESWEVTDHKIPTTGKSWGDVLLNCNKFGIPSVNNQTHNRADSQPYNQVHNQLHNQSSTLTDNSPVDVDWQEM